MYFVFALTNYKYKNGNAGWGKKKERSVQASAKTQADWRQGNRILGDNLYGHSEWQACESCF